MSDSGDALPTYRFGEYELDTARMMLRHGDEVVSIEPQVYDVLQFLLEHPGRVVRKEELLDGVWGDQFVSESALTSRIKAVRRAVGDDGRRQEVIRTAHGRGYEFVVPVEVDHPNAVTVGGDTSAPGQPPDEDPVVSASARPQLPARFDRLIGRDKAVAELAAAIVDDDVRLITLVGAGGVGKTSLALAVCREIESRFADGVRLVELVTVVDGAATIEAVATALDVQSQQGRDLSDSIVEVLRSRHGLILFDNCEHVAEPIGALTVELLRQAPDISIIATGREALDVANEQVWPVDPLPVVHDRPDDELAAMAVPAIELFTTRAAAADRRFELTADNVGAVAEICRRLDGVPLAIELAAARVRTLGVGELEQRLGERFQLLTSGRRDSDPRHRTLLDTVTWSYDLLESDEQELFTQLSVFAGPFDLAGVEAIHSGENSIDALSRLADRSMVTVRHAGVTTSYELFETMREFGRDLLDDSSRRSLSERHAAHFAGGARRLADEVGSPAEAAAIAWGHQSFADLRAAHRFAVQTGDVDLAMDLAASVREYGMRTMRYETFGWADAALGLDGADDHALFPLVKALQGYGSWVRGEFPLSLEQCAAATAGVEADDHVARALIARTEANVQFILSAYEEGLERCAEMRREAEATGRPSQFAHACYMSSVAHSSQGHADIAAEFVAAAQSAARESGSGTDAAGAHFAEGIAATLHEDPAALDSFAECDRISASVGNRWMSAFARTELNGLRLRMGRTGEAAAGFADVLDSWYRSGDWAQQWLTVSKAITALADAGDLDAAAELVGAVEVNASLAPIPSISSLREATVDVVDRLRTMLGDDRYDARYEAGAARPVDSVMHRTREALLRAAADAG